MTQNLTKMLELAFDPYNSRKRELVASLPRELSFYQDGELKTIKRELLLTEAIEGTGLVQTEVAKTVAEGANQAKCWMNVLPVYNIRGNAYIHSYGEGGMYAATVPEGAEVPNRTQNYGAATFAIKKFAQSPKISKEMIEDALVDAIALEIQFAGKAVMNSVEQMINNTILEGSGDEHDSAGANQGVKAVIQAAARARGNGFMPNAVVLHPEAEGLCLLDLAPSSNFGGQGVAGNGLMPPGYLGLSWNVCGVADVTGGTYTWDYDSDGDIGMLVVDTSRCGGVAVARPLTVDEFDDPIHDLRGMVVSMRADAKSYVSTAAVRVEY